MLRMLAQFRTINYVNYFNNIERKTTKISHISRVQLTAHARYMADKIN